MKEFFKTLAGLEISLPFSGRVDGLGAQLIWQFLRYNETYKSKYDQMKIEAANDDSGELPMYFAQNWCLSTTIDYNLATIPVERDEDDNDLSPHFEYKPVRALPRWKYLKDWGEFILPEDERVFIMNPFAGQDQVMRFLASQKPAFSKSAMRSSRQTHLVEYVVCHHYIKTLGMGPTEFSPIYHDIFKTGRSDILQTSSLDGKVEGFKELAPLAPWCFFTPPHR